MDGTDAYEAVTPLLIDNGADVYFERGEDEIRLHEAYIAGNWAAFYSRSWEALRCPRTFFRTLIRWDTVLLWAW